VGQASQVELLKVHGFTPQDSNIRVKAEESPPAEMASRGCIVFYELSLRAPGVGVRNPLFS
jgi:hypothetical protein